MLPKNVAIRKIIFLDTQTIYFISFIFGMYNKSAISCKYSHNNLSKLTLKIKQTYYLQLWQFFTSSRLFYRPPVEYTPSLKISMMAQKKYQTYIHRIRNPLITKRTFYIKDSFFLLIKGLNDDR